jgi:hypothetical protein
MDVSINLWFQDLLEDTAKEILREKVPYEDYWGYKIYSHPTLYQSYFTYVNYSSDDKENVTVTMKEVMERILTLK